MTTDRRLVGGMISQRSRVALSLLIFAAMILVDHCHTWVWNYTAWLFDYHFGFMKRGLVGTVLQSITGATVIPLLWVKCVSWALALAIVAFFLYVFNDLQRSIRNSEERRQFLSLFVFFMLSPVSLRNYFFDLGRFDQISIILLLLQWFRPPLLMTVTLSAIMVLVHENFFFIFMPVLLLIVFSERGLKPAFLVFATVTISTFITFKFGRPAVDIETLGQHLLSKANAPLGFNELHLFYVDVRGQLNDSWAQFQLHKKYFYGYLIYLILSIPVFWVVARLELTVVGRLIRWGVLMGYLAIVILTCDWCRHLTNAYLVCMFLLLYLMKTDGVRTSLMKSKIMSERVLYGAAALSLFLPAAGVEIPRLVKFFQTVSGG